MATDAVSAGAGYRPAGVVRVGDRTRGVAILLALCFGWMGAHRFYLGKARSGVFYLLFCWTYIPLILSVLTVLRWLGTSSEEFDRLYNLETIRLPAP